MTYIQGKNPENEESRASNNVSRALKGFEMLLVVVY